MMHFRNASFCLTALVISSTIAAYLDFGSDKLGLVTVAHAQSATATLNVTVIDPNGAAVPGANIMVTKASTQSRREAMTNAEGQVGIAQLAPGRYLVTASKQDFEVAQIENVVLNVGDLLGVRIQLKVGQIKASLTVPAAPSTYHESGSVSSVVDQQFIENLPLNGRSFNALLELTPGSVLAVASYSEPGQFSVNGQRQNANYFMIDGVSANVGISGGPQLEETSNGSVPAFTAFGGTNGMVSEDALQEFRIQTSTYAPEFGRSPGAQVSIVTRSGSNKFHGTAFEYLRNEALDANDWFANSFGLPKAKLRQNDFGGVFGGPLRRNRTFFFFSYEGLRLLLPNVFNSTVPSLSARQSAIPSTQPFLKALPNPNGTDFGNGLAQFVGTDSSPSTLDATSIRVDHVVNGKLSLFGRYNYAPSDTSLRGAFGTASQISRASSVPMTLTIGAQMITPRFTNDLRVNYSRVRGAIEYLMDNFGGAVPPPTDSIMPASAKTESSLFSISFGGAGSLLLGSQANNYQRQINIVDNVAIAAGSHQFGFGVDYRRLMPISGVHSYEFRTFFNGIDPAKSGFASQVVIIANFGRLYPVFTNFSAYAQDTWRMNQRLTLTYGMRWELNPPPHEAKGNDPFTVQGLDLPATATLAPPGRPLWETTYGNFAPRVGGAYLLNAKPGKEMILRGGLGIFYDIGNGPGSQAIFGSNYPHSAAKFFTNVQFPLTESQLALPAFSADPPYPTIYIADPHLVLPRTYEWNFAIEQSLGNTQTISASYVGAAGRRLLRRELLHNPNALFTDVHVTRNTATSDYDALEVQFQRRLARGLQAMASYTWSHSIDIASTESFVTTPAGSLDPRVDRGNSDFDVRHSVATAATFDLPSPKSNRFLRAVFGHWSMDAMLRARSATPVFIIQRPALGPLFGVPGVTRPNLVLNVPLYIHDKTLPGGKRINPAAFANAPTGQQGSLGRNAVRGFPVSQVDFAVRRRFALGERLHLQLRAEFFNLFNHPNFAIVTPADRFGRPDFGRANSTLNQALGIDATGLNQRYQLGGPRSIQLAAKLQF